MNKRLVRLTNQEYIEKYSVDRKHLPKYIETYSYKSLMFSIAFRELFGEFKKAFVSLFKK